MTTSALEAPPATAPARAASGVRADIQGLRALAVLVVLVFHFWPTTLTGGYVGVDVFFVISGFLISSHLLAHPPAGVHDLAAFWARRIRRLLPAASVVLVATLLACLAWLPSSQLPDAAREIAASALSVENWALARSATDYLAAENAASPVQHYWSLSVEEQFYVLWPVLIAVLGLVGARRAFVLRTAGLVVVTAASFGASVLLTRTDPAAAYFVTHTRIWELGLGSLLAVAVTRGWRLRGRALRAVVGWVGIAMVVAATVTFDGSTPFPGYTALLPTLGTVLVIAAACDDVAGSPRVLLSRRPARILGDLSYSVYLWHWPVVVLAPYALGRDLAWPEKLLAVAGVVAASALTKRFVEDPAHRSRARGGSLRLSFAVAASSALVLTGVGAAIVIQSKAAVAEETVAVDAAVGRDCIGAAALRGEGCGPVEGSDLVNSPTSARADKSRLYEDGCWSNQPYTAKRVCTYGREDATTRVALIGNSHAGQWEPALSPVVEERGWRLDTYLVSECYTVTAAVDFTAERRDLTRNCQSWNRWGIGKVAKGDYDLVVMSNRTFRQLVGVPASGRDAAAEKAYAQTLRTITATGTKVLVIRDTPGLDGSGPDCVAQHEDDPAQCASPRGERVPVDPLAQAAAKDTSGLVSVLDPTDRFCDRTTCHVVIGRLIAYFDHGHMTTAFARTLEPEVAEAVEQALR